MKLLVRISIVLFAILALLVGILMLILPGLIENHIEKNDIEWIGRNIEIGQIKLNYFNGGLKVQDLKIMEEDESEVFVGLDILEVNVAVTKYLQGKYIISKFVVDSLYTQLEQDEIHYNFQDILDHLQRDQDSIFIATTEDSIRVDEIFRTLIEHEFTVKNFVIKDSYLKYVDKLYGDHPYAGNWEFRLPSFTLADSSNLMDFRLEFEDGAYLDCNIDLDMPGKKMNVHLVIDDIMLEWSNALNKRFSIVNVMDISGVVSSDLVFDIDLGNIKNIDFSGELEVKDFSLIDEELVKFASCKEFYISIARANFPQYEVEVGKIDITGLNVIVFVYKEKNTFSMLMDLDDNEILDEIRDEERQTIPIDTFSKKERRKARKAQKKEEKRLSKQAEIQGMREDALDFANYLDQLLDLKDAKISVDSFLLGNSNVRINDQSMEHEFTLDMSEIELNAYRLGHESRDFVLSSTMNLNKTGSYAAHVHQLEGEESAYDILIEIKNFDLKGMTPYSLLFYGYPVEKGIFQMKSENSIRGINLVSSNDIDILDPKMSKKTQKGIYSLPMRFAISVVRNFQGNIPLDVDIKGTTNDPDLKIGKEIFEAFLNLLGNVATAPFKFIGKSLGLQNKDVRTIEFELLSESIPSTETEVVKKIGKYIQKNDPIGVQFVQCTDYREELFDLGMYHTKRKFYLQLPGVQLDSFSFDSLDFYLNEISQNDSTFLRYLNENAPNRELNRNEKALFIAGEEKMKNRLDSLIMKRNTYLISYLNSLEVPYRQYSVSSAKFDTLSAELRRPQYLIRFVPVEEL